MTVGGYMGKLLRVDLEAERITEEALQEEVLRDYLGGTGLGAKYLYDEVDPRTPWDDPANRLIITSGPLGGTRLDGSGSYAVTTKGPLTNGAASSQANGFFGAYLKFCGYDAVVIQGAARRWLYLSIEEGKAELREAAHLVGKDTWETEDLIKAELGKKERQASVFCVGPAGENRARFAAIVGDKGHVAGHNGIGAVMGSKRLKAVVAARGSRIPLVAHPERFRTLAKELFELRIQDPVIGKRHYEWGTSTLYSISEPLGRLPVRNLATAIFGEGEKFNGPYYRAHWKVKPNPCWACRNHHCYKVEVTEGPYAGFQGEEAEFEIMAAFGSLIGQTDPGAAMMLSNECDRLGLEGNEAGWLMSWLMECYERGLITGEQTGGLEMSWGNVEAVKAMLHRVAHREGFGDVLAEGVMRACEYLGGEARDCGIYLKRGNTPRTYDPRAMWSEILDEAVTDSGYSENDNLHQEEMGLEFTDTFSPEHVPALATALKGKRPFVDSLVVCFFCTGMFHKPMVGILNAVTGWDLTPEEGLRLGVRINNLMRAFDVRAGITPEVEVPSERLLTTVPDGPAEGKSIRPHWDQILDNYYRRMGWDRKTGKPLPQTLESLGLGYVIPHLWGASPGSH